MLGFQKKEEVKRQVVSIDPNKVPVQGSVIETDIPEQPLEQETEVKETNMIVSSEALENGTYRYTLISNKILSIGLVDIVNKQ